MAKWNTQTQLVQQETRTHASKHARMKASKKARTPTHRTCTLFKKYEIQLINNDTTHIELLLNYDETSYSLCVLR